jgi:hypothetical protein
VKKIVGFDPRFFVTNFSQVHTLLTDRRKRLSVNFYFSILSGGNFMNCICNLFNNESLIWIIIIAALLLSCYGNNGYAGGCGCGNNYNQGNGCGGCGCGC